VENIVKRKKHADDARGAGRRSANFVEVRANKTFSLSLSLPQQDDNNEFRTKSLMANSLQEDQKSFRVKCVGECLEISS
jgi:hypothetical protein